MQIIVDAKNKLRKWPHIEKYQNTTLRYTPDKRFPEAMEKYIGKPEIIRLFVTLDEVWDYRTDEYDWNYFIGVNKYENDKKHYHYDWPLTVPSPLGVHEEDYITSHALHAEKVLLNIRRYEREVIDGIISIEKYKEVFKKIVAYYKSLCPNIVYIEVCNEVEGINFGKLRIDEYYRLYKCAYNAIKELNEENKYDMPLEVGGFGMESGISHWKYWVEFLENLSRDKDRIIDFYSMHEYHTNPARILEFYVRHQSKIKELGLPNLPIFMTEYGLRTGPGDAGRPHNLQNASGEISGMLLGSYCDGMKMFPWCTFHNPNQQLGRTMFVLNENNEYVPTPSGHTMTMFKMLGEYELLVEGYTNNNAVATINDCGEICVLVSNPIENALEHEIIINNLDIGNYKVAQYLVDKYTNNWITDNSLTELEVTKSEICKSNGSIALTLNMNANAFCLYVLKKVI